jgi:endonuclease/exonuclease/phosphatase family metal-dependent hydrolase
MRIVSWNLNHRVGKTRFQPAAVDAAAALGADALFFNEYFPKDRGPEFAARLADMGWTYQLISPEPPERANRVFAASRIPVELADVRHASFDHQLPANVLPVRFPASGLHVIAVRVPAYEGDQRPRIGLSWQWLQATAATLVELPAVIVGDLNVKWHSPASAGGEVFRGLTREGWTLATSTNEPSYYPNRGQASTLDHLLHTRSVRVSKAEFVSRIGEFYLAGGKGALSDHAAVVADLDVQLTPAI